MIVHSDVLFKVYFALICMYQQGNSNSYRKYNPVYIGYINRILFLLC